MGKKETRMGIEGRLEEREGKERRMHGKGGMHSTVFNLKSSVLHSLLKF